jgi:hypothetical protein
MNIKRIVGDLWCFHECWLYLTGRKPKMLAYFVKERNERYKQLVIHAIIGRGFISPDQAIYFTDVRKLAYFSGNQWNEHWDWDIKKLHCLDIIELENIYLHRL